MENSSALDMKNNKIIELKKEIEVLHTEMMNTNNENRKNNLKDKIDKMKSELNELGNIQVSKDDKEIIIYNQREKEREAKEQQRIQFYNEEIKRKQKERINAENDEKEFEQKALENRIKLQSIQDKSDDLLKLMLESNNPSCKLRKSYCDLNTTKQNLIRDTDKFEKIANLKRLHKESIPDSSFMSIQELHNKIKEQQQNEKNKNKSKTEKKMTSVERDKLLYEIIGADQSKIEQILQNVSRKDRIKIAKSCKKLHTSIKTKLKKSLIHKEHVDERNVIDEELNMMSENETLLNTTGENETYRYNPQGELILLKKDENQQRNIYKTPRWEEEKFINYSTKLYTTNGNII